MCVYIYDQYINVFVDHVDRFQTMRLTEERIHSLLCGRRQCCGFLQSRCSISQSIQCSRQKLAGGFVPCAEYGHERRMGATYLGSYLFHRRSFTANAKNCAAVLGGDGKRLGSEVEQLFSWRREALCCYLALK